MAAKKEQVKDGLVPIMIPYIEGQDPECTVIINGRATKIKKGVEVLVKPNVAKVIRQSNQQVMMAQAEQERMRLQKTDL